MPEVDRRVQVEDTQAAYRCASRPRVRRRPAVDAIASDRASGAVVGQPETGWRSYRALQDLPRLEVLRHVAANAVRATTKQPSTGHPPDERASSGLRQSFPDRHPARKSDMEIASKRCEVHDRDRQSLTGRTPNPRRDAWATARPSTGPRALATSVGCHEPMHSAARPQRAANVICESVCLRRRRHRFVLARDRSGMVICSCDRVPHEGRAHWRGVVRLMMRRKCNDLEEA